MIKIPGQQKRYSQPNNSDLFGNIYYSKNLNFDEEGYIKLSPRSVALVSSGSDANFDLPAAFGRQQSGYFDVATINNPYEIQMNASGGVSAALDNDSGGDTPPDLTVDSHGAYYNNRWHATEDQLLTYKTQSNGNWTDTAVALTSGKLHPLAVFENRQSLCIGNGNQVLQVNTSYASTGDDLVIPSKFEVTKLAYNNNRMAVGTKFSPNTISGQNGEAYLFIWNGAVASAGQGFAVGSDYIYDVVAYQSSFVVLTRSGRGLYFNGGGFDPLFSLPVWYTSKTWGDAVNSECVGDIMTIEGDIIYINVNNSSEQNGVKSEEYIHNAPGGILCFDPKVGLTHRVSPSISLASRLTVTASNVNTSTDVLTTTAGTIPSSGSPIKYMYDGATPIIGLTPGKVYYSIKLTSSTFQLAETREKALSGVYIDITSQSSGTSYFLAVELQDYGQSYMQRTGAVALAEKTDQAFESFVFGAELQRADATTDYEYACFTVSGFPNIGYFVTPRLTSDQVEDFYNDGFIKHARLESGDSITVKVQTEELAGVPVTTPQYGNRCTWSGTNEFYTSANFSEAKTYLDASPDHELECEIIAGAGGGQMSQIAEINYEPSTGVYSVVLDDEIEGVAASNICDVKIENFKLVTVLDSTKDQIQDFKPDTNGGWAKFKVILRGVNVKIQETIIGNSTKQYGN